MRWQGGCLGLGGSQGGIYTGREGVGRGLGAGAEGGRGRRDRNAEEPLHSSNGLALIPYSSPLLFTFCFSFLAFLARFFVLCVDAALRPSWVQASPRSYFGVFECLCLSVGAWRRGPPRV